MTTFQHATPRRPGALSPLALALASALTLAGCATAPPPPDPGIAVPAHYQGLATPASGPWAPARPAEAQPRGAWWQVFHDPKLDELEQAAQTASPTLAVAAARVQAARASLRGSQADRLPQLGLSLGAGRQKAAAPDLGVPQGTPVSPATAWRGGLTASYEVDLFQRVANEVDAGRADAEASEASYRSVLLALQADVAQTYFQLRTLDAELDVLARGLSLREQTVQLVQKRFDAGDVGELDVARAKTDLASTRAEQQGVQGERARAQHALALLLGRAPAAFELAHQALREDSAVPEVPPGLPSTLLERRPDVVAAQARMMAATARVGQARSALFPALVLTANGGYASYELKDLFDWSARTWLTSAVLSLPLFDGGRNRARIQGAEAQLNEAVASYRQAVLAAFGDVEDKLSALSTVRAQSVSLDEALVSARRSADLADKRYQAGEDSFLTLLDTRRSLLAVERQAITLRGGWTQSTVGLIRALGGQWDAHAPAGT